MERIFFIDSRVKVNQRARNSLNIKVEKSVKCKDELLC